MDTKKEALKAFFGLLYVVAILLTIRYFKLSFWGVYLFLYSTSVIRLLYFWWRYKTKPTIKSMFKSAISLYLILIFFRILFRYLSGFWGFVIGCTVIAIVILIRRRKKYIEVKHRIETMIWGAKLKDLPKSYWKKN